MENKIWRCSSDGKENIVDRLISESGVVRSVALYLASRGITPETLGRYLNATFADLSDPFRFIGIEAAVKRLWQAIRNRERILIHGDYDTDGITATALLSWVLERNGGLVTSFLPHRFDDGYGFTPDSLLKALEMVPGGKCGVLVRIRAFIHDVRRVAAEDFRKCRVGRCDEHRKCARRRRCADVPQRREVLVCEAAVGTSRVQARHAGTGREEDSVV